MFLNIFVAFNGFFRLIKLFFYQVKLCFFYGHFSKLVGMHKIKQALPRRAKLVFLSTKKTH